MENKDQYAYKGWLNSDFFWKRCAAVVGYYFVGSMIIGFCVVVFFVVLGIALGLGADGFFTNIDRA